MATDSNDSDKNQKPVQPKAPAPKPHQKFIEDHAKSGAGKHAANRGKARIIRHQGR